MTNNVTILNNTIEDGYCSIEVSRGMKEKNFSSTNLREYFMDTTLSTSTNPKEIEKEAANLNTLRTGIYYCTHFTALKWLRDNFKLHIKIEAEPNNKWFFVLEDISEETGFSTLFSKRRFMPRTIHTSEIYSNFEEATNAAILRALDSIKK